MSAMLKQNNLFFNVNGTSFLSPSSTPYNFVIRFLVSLGHHLMLSHNSFAHWTDLFTRYNDYRTGWM